MMMNTPNLGPTMTATFLTGVALACLILTAAAPSLQGRNIVEHGNTKGAPACMSCHGAKLEGNLTLKIPALAGLPAVTILARLDHYAGPDGHNPTMRAVATALDRSERIAVANYIASLPKTTAAQ